MITEGLLMYLPAATIEALAATATASHWLLDAASLDMARRVRMDSYQSIENVRAADHLDGIGILDVVEAPRLDRTPPLQLWPAAM